MDPDLLQAIQHYTARSAITSSSMRGPGNAGVVRSGREFLSELSLTAFSATKRGDFNVSLDNATNDLVKAFPKTARHWGRARKGLNIFLRGCLYTSYLRDHYNLGRAEPFFEIPLDSITGAKLVEKSAEDLPRWKTVRGLDPQTSAKYQEAADRLAAKAGIARVHLDAMWWGRRE